MYGPGRGRGRGMGYGGPGGRGRGGGGGGGYRDDRQGRPHQDRQEGIDNRRRPPSRDDSQQIKRERPEKSPPVLVEGSEPKREPIREPPPHGSPRQQQSPEAPRNNPSSQTGIGSLNDLNLEEILHEKKFSYRARLFVANIRDMTQEDFKKLFEPFGEFRECHVVKEKGIGFITMAFRFLAERAIRDLDGKEFRGKKMLVRYSESTEGIEVTHLSDAVSNEVLGEAFSQFGPVANAVVASDSRGKSLNYGIVFFENRQSVQKAIKTCSENLFLLTASSKPVLVKEYISKDLEEGVAESKISRYHWVQRERSLGPRFANQDMIEQMVAQKWMSLFQAQERKKAEFEQSLKEDQANLEKDLKADREKMEAEVRIVDLMRQKEQTMRMLEQIQRQEDQLKSGPPQHPPMEHQGPPRGLMASGNPGNHFNHPPMGGGVPPLLPTNHAAMVPKLPLQQFSPHLPMEPPMHRGDPKPHHFRGPLRKF